MLLQFCALGLGTLLAHAEQGDRGTFSGSASRRILDLPKPHETVLGAVRPSPPPSRYEPIRFTGSTPSSDAGLTENRQSQMFAPSGFSNILKQRNDSTDVLNVTAGSSRTSPTRKKSEEDEESRNWIFQDSEKKDSKTALGEKKEEDGLRKTAMEKYYESQSRKGQAATNAPVAETSARKMETEDSQRYNSSSERLVRPETIQNADSRRDSSRDVVGVGNPGVRGQAEGGRISPGTDDSKRGAGAPRSALSPADRIAERQAMENDVRTLLGSPPAAGGGGLNLTDLSKRELSGGALVRPGSLPGSGSSLPSGLPGSRSSAGSLGGGFDAMTARPMIDPGVPNGLLKSPEPVRMQPKPLVLEIPKRKF
jgi:hypothetical protein